MACGHAPGFGDAATTDDCACTAEDAAKAGTIVLKARSTVGFAESDQPDHPFWTTGYWNAAVSFERGGLSGSIEQTRNDWDLVFGNDRDETFDRFSVNTVTDDRSFIVDLGELQLRDAPVEVDPTKVPPQDDLGFGPLPPDDVRRRDAVHVVEGHVYWVRTVDDDSRLVTLVGVQKHELNRSVTLVWFRSSDPDRFVFDWPK